MCNTTQNRCRYLCSIFLSALILLGAKVGRTDETFPISRLEINLCFANDVVATPTNSPGLPRGQYYLDSDIYLGYVGALEACGGLDWYVDGALIGQGIEVLLQAQSFVTRVDLQIESCDCVELPRSEYHSADVNRDGGLDLPEILRVIQLYSSMGYSCVGDSEDGFSISNGTRECYVHSADYLFPAWKIGLSELLRVIQIYNAPGGYQACADGEDHFCPIWEANDEV